MSRKHSHYHFDQQPIKRRSNKRTLLLLFGIFLLIVIGIYLFVVFQAPDIMLDSSESAKSKETTLVSQKRDFVKVDKLNLVVPIEADPDKAYASGEIVWKNPETDDNNQSRGFILCATRFKLGTTPQATKTQSPFYHIEKLSKDDEIDVYFQDQWYSYKVSDVRRDSPVESSSSKGNFNQASIKMYTCSNTDDSDSQFVVTGEPIVTQKETQKATSDSGSSLL